MAYKNLKISSKNCIYRGEGNANLVFKLKIHGEEDKIVRLLKNIPCSKVDSSTVLKILENAVAMMENVTRPLLGNGIVHCPEIVWLSMEQIKDINRVVSIHRPLFRCHKTIKEVDTPVLVFPDFCSIPKRILKHVGVGPVISVEIKPKQGFIESDATLIGAMDQPVCIFCMRQYYKLKNNSILKRSGYCPISLFSGCPKKMQQAIRELFKTPQNNFRIFKDQDLVYADEKKMDLNLIFGEFFGECSEEIYILKFGCLLKKLLLRPLDSIACSKNIPETNREGVECSSSATDCPYSDPSHIHRLPKNCILERIAKLQSLCAIDIDVVYSFHEKLKQMNLSKDEDIIGVQPRNQLPRQIGQQNQMPFESELQFMSRKVWEFLLSLMFKDCSIMITLKLLESNFKFPDAITDFSEENIILDDVGNRYFFSIAVIDLDRKLTSRIEKIFNTKELIIMSYLSATQTGG